jgi:hypothetical protein
VNHGFLTRHSYENIAVVTHVFARVLGAPWVTEYKPTFLGIATDSMALQANSFADLGPNFIPEIVFGHFSTGSTACNRQPGPKVWRSWNTMGRNKSGLGHSPRWELPITSAWMVLSSTDIRF